MVSSFGDLFFLPFEQNISGRKKEKKLLYIFQFMCMEVWDADLLIYSLEADPLVFSLLAHLECCILSIKH